MEPTPETEPPKITKIIYENAEYIGEVKNGKRHGKGKITFSDGREYEGLWEDDLRIGYGVKKYLNGDHYVGSFSMGKAHGKGIYTWQNSDIYDGEWKNGVKEGNGMWKGINNESYIGEWKNSKADGYGVQVWASGDRYEGEWTQGLRNGNGTMIFANGDMYIGDHVKGKMHGEGQYIWRNGSIYIGQFKNGFKHGKGKWKKDKNDQECNQYDGEYENDVKNGFGGYKWKSGNEYKGRYKDNLRHGYGEMFWTDGSVYKGMWHKGIQHGKGRMEFPDGNFKEGIFQNNIFQGQIYNRLNLYQHQPMKNSNHSSLDRLANSTAVTFNSTKNKKYGGSSNKVLSKCARNPSSAQGFVEKHQRAPHSSIKITKNFKADFGRKYNTNYRHREVPERIQLISEQNLSNGSSSLCRERLSIEENKFNTYYGGNFLQNSHARKQAASSISTKRNRVNRTVTQSSDPNSQAKRVFSLRKKTKSSKRKYRKGFIEQNLNKSKNSYATSKITNVIAKSYRKRSKDAPPGSKRDEKIINNLSKVLHSTQMRMRQNKDKKSLQSLISLQRKRQMENSLQSSQNG
ncbi:unnamed protein product [Moneuplotes crassus]|uniref:Phosphatidylinositol-4-phosphate 5-kinase n=1 Tax=Euplotes crassus TaxID=5936 RepID=A0AAD1U2N7_EUPCR|nr:unnamed protein product [Moneuplotes crassus]